MQVGAALGRWTMFTSRRQDLGKQVAEGDGMLGATRREIKP